jgi:soluble lytic murein transglycosylase-like protein
MPGTARELGYTPEEMNDPAKAADAGARYVRKMYDRFGDWDSAVEAYNAGPARVAHRKAKGIPLPGETRRHVKRVKAAEAAEALARRE